MKNLKKVDDRESDINTVSSLDTNDHNNHCTMDTFPKPIFQRGGQFEPEMIRKRYVFSRTHWLKGDGYDGNERKKWVKKPDPEYIKTYEVEPGDIRYKMHRSRSVSCISSRDTASQDQSIMNAADIVSAKETREEQDNADSGLQIKESSKETKRNINKNTLDYRVRSKSANVTGIGQQPKREELPHQKHHDFRKLKEIFNCPRPTYDRLKRDRETLTQHEKELLILLKIKRESKKKLEAITIAEEELKQKQEITPDQRSDALLKQVIKQLVSIISSLNIFVIKFSYVFHIKRIGHIRLDC